MSKILGIGTDIIEISRIRTCFKETKEKFLSRIFTAKEQSYCLKRKDPAPELAARFAAKEAVAKALGTGIGKSLSWKDIEIINNTLGKPEIFLSKKAQKTFKNPTIHLSLSHCKEYAVATALAMLNAEC